MLGFRLLKSADRQLVLNLVQSNRPDEGKPGWVKERGDCCHDLRDVGDTTNDPLPVLTEDDIASSSHRDRNQSFG